MLEAPKSTIPSMVVPVAQPLATSTLPAPQGTTTVPPKVIAPQPVVRPNIQQQVAAQQAARTPFPPSLRKGNTNTMTQQWFRCCLYSEYKARKTTTAGRFAPPEDTFIVLTRSPEQLKPFEGSGYDFAHCQDATALRYALMFPEKVAREGWAKNPNRTLVVDDLSEGVVMLLSDALAGKANSGYTRMRAHDASGSELRELLTGARNQPQHLIVVCLAKSRENPITNDERVGPDLPPAMLNFVMTDLDHIFYINPQTWQILTERHGFSYEDVDSQGIKQVYRREIFAGHKVPYAQAGKVLAKYEPLDLGLIWQKIRSGGKPSP